MSATQPNLPGAGVTARIQRDDGVTFVGVTLPVELYTPGLAATRLASAPGLSAGEMARARNAASVVTRQPREPFQEGQGWAIYHFPGTTQVYVLRDDGSHLSWGAANSLFTPVRAAATLAATPGLSAGETARLTGLVGGVVAAAAPAPFFGSTSITWGTSALIFGATA